MAPSQQEGVAHPVSGLDPRSVAAPVSRPRSTTWLPFTRAKSVGLVAEVVVVLAIMGALAFLTGLYYLSTDSCPVQPPAWCNEIVEEAIRSARLRLGALSVLVLATLVPTPKVGFGARTCVLGLVLVLALMTTMTWRAPW